MEKKKQPPGEPMDLGNMRRLCVAQSGCPLPQRCTPAPRVDRRVEVSRRYRGSIHSPARACALSAGRVAAISTCGRIGRNSRPAKASRGRCGDEIVKRVAADWYCRFRPLDRWPSNLPCD